MKNLNRSKDVKGKQTPPKQSIQAGFNTLSKEFPGPGRWFSGYKHLPPSLMTPGATWQKYRINSESRLLSS